MRSLSYLSIFILSIFSLNCFAAEKGADDYEISGNGTGTQGTYLVTITAITKNKNISDAELSKCAVHGVLFRGFSNKELRQSQKPLAGSASVEAQHSDFFKSFFSGGGTYRNYVSEVSGSRKVIKSGKYYKVSATVSVNKDQLRRDLEEAGVIKRLNSIF